MDTMSYWNLLDFLYIYYCLLPSSEDRNKARIHMMQLKPHSMVIAGATSATEPMPSEVSLVLSGSAFKTMQTCKHGS